MSDRKQSWLAAGALLLLVLCLYAPSLENGFVDWDDGSLIEQNPIVHGLTWEHIKSSFSTYDPELYTPLTFLSYQLTYAIADLQPFAYHLGNVMLHALNAILILWMVYVLRRKKFEAFVCGLLFAVHPLNTEAVAWASARKDVLAAFFFLSSIVAYLYRGEGKKYYFLSILFFLLGLLSKVSILMLPLALVLIDRLQGRHFDRKQLMEKAPYMFLSIVFGIVAVFGKFANTSFYWEKFLLGCKAIVFYLGKLFLPGHFSLLYPYTQTISLASTDILLSVLAVIALCVTSILVRKRYPLVFFCWWWYVILLLPTFTTIAKGHDAALDVYFASDRYAYVPSIGILILIATVVDVLYRKFQAVAIAFVSFTFLVLIMLTYHQSLVWSDTESLFRSVLASYPNSHVAHTQLGVVLFNRDEIDGAFAEFQKALAIRPDGTAYYDIGQIYLKKGMIDEAMQAYRSAIVANPVDPDPYINLGALLLQQGKDKEALAILEPAKDLKSDSRLYINLGLAYEHLGRKKDAIDAYKRALELDPENEEIRQSLSELSQ